MSHAASSQVVAQSRDERLRERPSWPNSLGPVIVSVLGVVAVCLAASAITVVTREPFGTAGVVLPTRPLTTMTAVPPPPSEAPIPPPVARVPTGAPTAIAPTIVAPSAPPSAPPPPPPKPSSTRRSSTPAKPSSVHPTTHKPFPQETTDFLGPPGTNG